MLPVMKNLADTPGLYRELANGQIEAATLGGVAYEHLVSSIVFDYKEALTGMNFRKVLYSFVTKNPGFPRAIQAASRSRAETLLLRCLLLSPSTVCEWRIFGILPSGKSKSGSAGDRLPLT